MRKPIKDCPLDTIVFLKDEYGNMYLGTVTLHKSGRYVTRGECIYGDKECFYRNALIEYQDV